MTLTWNHDPNQPLFTFKQIEITTIADTERRFITVQIPTDDLGGFRVPDQFVPFLEGHIEFTIDFPKPKKPAERINWRKEGF